MNCKLTSVLVFPSQGPHCLVYLQFKAPAVYSKSLADRRSLADRCNLPTMGKSFADGRSLADRCDLPSMGKSYTDRCCRLTYASVIGDPLSRSSSTESTV